MSKITSGSKTFILIKKNFRKLSKDYLKNEKFKQRHYKVRVEKLSNAGPPKNEQCTSEILTYKTILRVMYYNLIISCF